MSRDLGFTHVELLPVTEHPFDGSWGYQTTGWFAPTSRFGTPDDLRAFVDAAHAAGIGVIVDWVPGHFPTDDFSLGAFRRHEPLRARRSAQGLPPRVGHVRLQSRPHRGRATILLASALFWLREFHIDGLRVDAVVVDHLPRLRPQSPASGSPTPTAATRISSRSPFCAASTRSCTAEVPGAMTIAEESTAYAGVTRPVFDGGLGFGFKWNMGWMHDTLETS